MSLSILWLGRIFPLPLNAGDRVYSAGLVGAVARAGARVVFLGLSNPDEPMGALTDLEPMVQWRLVPGAPRNRFLTLLSTLPMVGARFATKQYRKEIARELATNRYDVVVIDQYGMGWALFEVQRRALRTPVIVHLAHNFETEVTAEIARNFSGDALRRLLLFQNARKTRLLEQRLARHCSLLVALTEQDSAAFAAINPILPKLVLPPGYCGPRQRKRTVDNTVPRRAIIVGSFSWIAKQMNLQRFLEVASTPFTRHGLELHVVGFVPDPLVSRLRARFPWVVFRGFVDDLNREFQKARVALVPEETGGGFKLKILDYIFGRVPIAAIESALKGIPERLKPEFLVAEDLSTLVSKIIETIDDTERLNLMQTRAFELAEDVFNWDVNGRRFLEELKHRRAPSGMLSLPVP